MEVRFFYELERLRGELVTDASAGPHNGPPTEPVSGDPEADRDRGDTPIRSEQGT
jgi:hypothetical protein